MKKCERLEDEIHIPRSRRAVKFVEVRTRLLKSDQDHFVQRQRLEPPLKQSSLESLSDRLMLKDHSRAWVG